MFALRKQCANFRLLCAQFSISETLTEIVNDISSFFFSKRNLLLKLYVLRHSFWTDKRAFLRNRSVQCYRLLVDTQTIRWAHDQLWSTTISAPSTLTTPADVTPKLRAWFKIKSLIRLSESERFSTNTETDTDPAGVRCYRFARKTFYQQPLLAIFVARTSLWTRRNIYFSPTCCFRLLTFDVSGTVLYFNGYFVLFATLEAYYFIDEICELFLR